MKKISILLLMVFAACMSFAQQTQNYIPKFGTGGSILNSAIYQDAVSPYFTGINTSSPATQLHIHNPYRYRCGIIGPFFSNTDDFEIDTIGNATSVRDGCVGQSNPIFCSESEILLTNNITGATINDGLLIRTANLNGSIKLQHAGILDISTCNSLQQYFEEGRVTILGNNYRFSFTETGFGVGAANPLTSFHVVGNSIFTKNNAVPTSAAYIKGSTTYTSATDPDYTWYGNASTGMFHPNLNIIGFSTTGVERMRIDASGNVAIGTTDPKGYKFAVNGKMIATEYVCKLQANWPDFVFSTDYKLPTLFEVKQFINEHKHLPGVPSAAEVEESGIQLGEMNAILLQKIEEQMRYILEQQEAIEKMSRRLEFLEKELKKE